MSAADVLGPVVGAVAGAVAVGITGRWLTMPGRARRVHHTKAEAELMHLLPEGPAKASLTEKVEVDVLTHIKLEANRKFDRLWWTAMGLLVVQAVLVGGLFASLISSATNARDPLVPNAIVPFSLVLLVLIQIPEYFVIRAMRAIRSDSKGEAEVESAGAAGTGHLNLFGGQSDAPRPAGQGHLDLSAGD